MWYSRGGPHVPTVVIYPFSNFWFQPPIPAPFFMYELNLFSVICGNWSLRKDFTSHCANFRLCSIPPPTHSVYSLFFSLERTLFLNSLHPLLLPIVPSLMPMEHSRSFHGIRWWPTWIFLNQIFIFMSSQKLCTFSHSLPSFRLGHKLKVFHSVSCVQVSLRCDVKSLIFAVVYLK